MRQWAIALRWLQLVWAVISIALAIPLNVLSLFEVQISQILKVDLASALPVQSNENEQRTLMAPWQLAVNRDPRLNLKLLNYSNLKTIRFNVPCNAPYSDVLEFITWSRRFLSSWSSIETLFIDFLNSDSFHASWRKIVVAFSSRWPDWYSERRHGFIPPVCLEPSLVSTWTWKRVSEIW